MKLDNLLQGSTLDRKISKKLIGDLLKISPERLFLGKNDLVISPAIYKKFKKAEMAIAERGLPYQYAIGRGWFYGREFIVNRNVLIPRPETELMVKKAVGFLRDKIMNSESGMRNKKTIIDVGTGSGCVAISAAIEIAKLKVSRLAEGEGVAWPSEKLKVKFYATDISEDALDIARKNARIHQAKTKFLKSDLLDNPKLPKKFDLILANLPYLPSSDIAPDNSIYHEPKIALDGGKDGLDLIRRLIKILPERLNREGLAILEIDPRQRSALTKFAKKFPLNIIFQKDFDNRTRLILLTIE